MQVSPDTGPYGGRAQRVELKAGAGIQQWTWLPLHRTRKYEFELLARSPGLSALKLCLRRQGTERPCAEATLTGLSPGWQRLAGTLAVEGELPSSLSPSDGERAGVRGPTSLAPSDGERAGVRGAYCLVLSSESGGQLVIAHLFLRPADHVGGADPDVVRLLKEARLPLLRWPGGNFVSAYHWEDGVGPAERRPTLPNYAWGGVEPNTFGTDEFIAFCRAVGCEPMICVNAGTGTPDEAARWVEYCNGPATSPLGARRAANGHPEPYAIRDWEIGNELWGRWQAHWTTPSGYVDRYQQFAAAMRKADPSVALYACGAPAMWGKNWNDILIAGAGAGLRSITDHPLIGGDLDRTSEPLAVFRDFMRVPDILEGKWRALRQDMEQAGLRDPRLAVTELQMFAHIGGGRGSATGPAQLGPQNLVNPGTLAEALYDTLIYHRAARLQPFVELITHSATVNHGGGLRKEHERVYPNPCYYANLFFADFAEARPARTELQAPLERAAMILPDIKNAAGEPTFPAVDALAAVAPNGDLLLSLVHRGTAGPIRLKIQLDGFPAAAKAQLHTLSGPAPWAVNSLTQPAAIQPVRSETEVQNGSLSIVLEAYSVVQARLRHAER